MGLGHDFAKSNPGFNQPCTNLKLVKKWVLKTLIKHLKKTGLNYKNPGFMRFLGS